MLDSAKPGTLLGQRFRVDTAHYRGPVLVLEYHPDVGADPDYDGPYYCHDLDNCDHEECDETCKDKCMDAGCRGWYGDHQLTPLNTIGVYWCLAP